MSLGRPEDLMEELATAIETPRKIRETAAPSSLENTIVDEDQPTPSASSGSQLNMPTATSTPQEGISCDVESAPNIQPVQDFDSNCLCKVCKQLGKPPRVEPGNICIPVWSVQKCAPQREISFEMAILNRMKGPADKPVAKRRKVHMKTKVLTDEEYVAELKRLEEDAAKKARKEAVALKKKKTASKKIDFGRSKRKNACDDDDDDDNDVDDVDQDEDDEIDEETEEEVLEGSEDDDEEGLIKLWKSIAPPTNESDLLGKWFGVIY